MAITRSVEETFWIIVGIIRQYPRPFTVNKSVMEDDTNSIMRYEMIAFRTMIEKTMPDIHKKLQEMCLSVESLVYSMIERMYSSYFKSDIVYRLWD